MRLPEGDSAISEDPQVDECDCLTGMSIAISVRPQQIQCSLLVLDCNDELLTMKHE